MTCWGFEPEASIRSTPGVTTAGHSQSREELCTFRTLLACIDIKSQGVPAALLPSNLMHERRLSACSSVNCLREIRSSCTQNVCLLPSLHEAILRGVK